VSVRAWGDPGPLSGRASHNLKAPALCRDVAHLYLRG